MSRRNGKSAEPTTVELNGLERLLLGRVLPGEGTLITVRVVREFCQVLEFTSDEIAANGIPINGNVTFAQLEAVPAKPITVGPIERELIVAGLEALDKAEKVTAQHVSLYEKFGVEPGAG